MKKQFFLISFTFLSLSGITNCSNGNDDEPIIEQNNPQTSTQYFHPPSWIKGTWSSTSSDPVKYKFTDNDFISVNSNTATSNTAQLKYISNIGGIVSVEEIANTTQYYFTMKMNSSNITYQFKKISDTKLLWVNHPSGAIINIYLYKQ